MMFYRLLFLLFAIISFSCSKIEITDTGLDSDYLVFEVDVFSETFENEESNNSASIKSFRGNLGSGLSSLINGDLYTDVVSNLVSSENHIGGDLSFDPSNSIREFVNVAYTFPGATGNSPEGTRVRLESGVYVKVLVFDDRDRFLGSSNVVVGARTQIKIKPRDLANTSGMPYRMVAFSFNTKNETDLPNFSMNGGNDPNMELVLPTDKEFLYYNGVVASSSGIHTLVLRPKTSKVGVTVNARSLGAKVKGVKGAFGAFSYKNTALFDLKFNTVVNELGASTLVPLDFEVDLTVPQDSLSINRYFYIPVGSTQDLTDFKVTFSEINLFENSATTNVLSNSYSKTFAGFTLKNSLHYNQTFYLFRGFQVGGILWSYGNLYYDFSVSNWHYKFRKEPNEGKGAIGTDYWVSSDNEYFMLPNVRSGATGDPCNKVYPSGKWRMPTYSEAEALLSGNVVANGLSRYFSNTNSSSRFVQYKNTLGQILRFYAHGYYNLNTAISPDLTASFFLWSFTGANDPRGLVFTISSNTEANNNAAYTGTSTDAIVNYDDDIATPKMNIRCVRTKQQ